ncbi:MAG TPA: response regulator [Chloroflexota bacterium]|nr:response regulator [Chloroflexota bacterium]
MALRYALVLDDDTPLREHLRDALSTEGWTVRCSARSETAFNLSVLRRPDMVLLDVSEPVYAPEAVAAGLRIHYGPQLPILAIAARRRPDVVDRIGAYSFLRKPFELERLLRLMERGQRLSERSAELRSHSESALERMRRLRLLEQRSSNAAHLPLPRAAIQTCLAIRRSPLCRTNNE